MAGKICFSPTATCTPRSLTENLHVSYKEPKILYRNLRNGHFEDVSSKMGPALRAENVARGCAFGDFDNDGDVDIVVNNLDGPPTLLRNDGGNKNNWMMIKCIGTRRIAPPSALA